MNTSLAFSVMVKPRGAICSLNCAYCYYSSKAGLYPGSDFRMKRVLLEDFTRQYIEAQHVPEAGFFWQGGEPTLMGLDFFRMAVKLQKQYCRPGMKITNALQTNGIALNEPWCRFFREHGFLVGLSLDGPRLLHDAYRADKRGKPTFDRVLAGARLLRRCKVDFNILACVHAANADHAVEVYRFLRDEAEARFIQFIPVVERGPDGKATSRSVTGPQYGRFLAAVFDEWVYRDVGSVFVQIFDAALGAWLGLPASLCIFQKECGGAMVLEHNGDLYACDHFVDPDHRLGNITETPLVELVLSAQQKRFGEAKAASLPADCRDCGVLFACAGGCPKDRLLCTQRGEPGLNWLCEGYKAFFAHIDAPMRAMAAELRAGRTAANIVSSRSRSALDGPCGV